MNDKKTIMLTGGGTGGSVSPLLAMVEDLKKQGEFDFVWIGTRKGPERGMVSKEGIDFIAIPSGKLRRYFSWQNFLDVANIISAFFYSFYILKKRQPDLVISAGSFVSVPVVWAARLMKIKIMIHQLDVRPGLANKLMAPYADLVTVTFEKSLNDYRKKAVWVGTPIRDEIVHHNVGPREAKTKMNLKFNLPTILVMGGGTGATAINELIYKTLPKLTEICQVVHITGKGKGPNMSDLPDNYFPFEFMTTDGIIKAYSVADVVISRCGLASLSELSFLGKPSILIPIPNSHQVDNARIFSEKDAAIVLDQDEITDDTFFAVVSGLLVNEQYRQELSEKIKTAIKIDLNQEITRNIRNLLS